MTSDQRRWLIVLVVAIFGGAGGFLLVVARMYANHSCRPNAETHLIGHKVIIRALKNIRPGVEITYNYGRDYLTNVITRRGCKYDKCRKKRADARVKPRTKGR